MANTRLRARIAVGLSVLALGGVAWVVADVRATPARPSDFAADLRSLDREIASLRPASADARANPDAAVRLAYRVYSHAALTARAEDFDELERLVDRLEKELGPQRDISLLRSALYMRVHRLDAARAVLERSTRFTDDPDAQLIAADIDLQRGQYARAQRTYEQVIERSPTWAALARLAFVTARRGDPSLADRLYARAADDLTAKEMRSYAWVEVQRGQLAFTHGRYDEAEAHYRLAERAYSGYWLVDEYIGELRAAQGRFAESIARYQRAITRAPRPDLLQQLGDVYAFAGRVEESRRWHDQALAGYLASARRGEVQFLHHLAGYYADVARNGGEAVKWARMDAQLRPSYLTDAALAWALYVDGQIEESVRVVDRALDAGMVDSHLYYHASTIKGAAGDAVGAARLSAELRDVNPRYRDFHAHR